MFNKSAHLLGGRNKELLLTIHHPGFLSTVTPFSLRAELWWLDVGHESQLFDSSAVLVVSFSPLSFSDPSRLSLWPRCVEKCLQIKGSERKGNTHCVHQVCMHILWFPLQSGAIFMCLIMPSSSRDQWQNTRHGRSWLRMLAAVECHLGRLPCEADGE